MIEGEGRVASSDQRGQLMECFLLGKGVADAAIYFLNLETAFDILDGCNSFKTKCVRFDIRP